MPQTLTACFKFGGWSVVGARDRCCRLARGADQKRLCIEHLKHMLGIRCPVGCKVQIAIRPKKRRQIMNQLWLDQPALVVSLFMPGIREENMDRIERIG